MNYFDYELYTDTAPKMLLQLSQQALFSIYKKHLLHKVSNKNNIQLEQNAKYFNGSNYSAILTR